MLDLALLPKYVSSDEEEAQKDPSNLGK